MSTIVVGGGWSGLAAATTLAARGQRVTLFEADTQLGGRARALLDPDWPIDNGQHFLLGCYRETLALLEQLALPADHYIKRNLLRLEMRSAQHESLALHTPNVAAPMHLLWGMMRMKGVRLHERGTVFRLCARLIRNNFQIDRDLPLEQWLLQNGQTRRLIDYFWQPLTLVLLNTPVKEASTQVLLNLLRKSFIRDRDHSDLLFMRAELNEQLPQQARRVIEKHGGEVRLGEQVHDLLIEDGRVTGVKINQECHYANHVIIATPAWIAANLLSDHEALRPLAEQLHNFTYKPTTTIYLRYPQQTRLGREMLGLVNMHGHWLFDRSVNGQDGIMGVVIYGEGAHTKQGDSTLIDQTSREIAQLFPNWPRPMDARVVRVEHAVLDCPPEINAYRPEIHTPIKGLWLAGDYINSDYPPRLESAVKSGMRCAREILKGSM